MSPVLVGTAPGYTSTPTVGRGGSAALGPDSRAEWATGSLLNSGTCPAPLRCRLLLSFSSCAAAAAAAGTGRWSSELVGGGGSAPPPAAVV